ncbi:MAG: ABC transporter transmembrane domain-containing protein [Bacteroidota bacterium]
MSNAIQNQEEVPAKKSKVTRGGLQKLAGIFRFVTPYRGYFVLGMAFLVLSTGTTLLFPSLLGELVGGAVNQEMPVDQVPANKAIKEFIENISQEYFRGETPSESPEQIGSGRINAVAGLLVILLLLQAFFSFFRIYLFAQVSERAMADIRLNVYQKIITLPMAFFEKRRVGELISRISSDVTQLQDVLSITLAEFFRQIFTLIFGIFFLFLISTQLTLFMLATFPVLIIAAVVFGRYIRKLSRKAQDELAEANVIVDETFQSIQAVKAFANEMLEVFRYRTALGKVVSNALKAATYRGGFVSFIFIALFGSIILVIWFGAHMVNDGVILISDLFSFILFTAFIGGSVAGMGSIYGQIQKTIGASERLLEILDEPAELVLPEIKAKSSVPEFAENCESLNGGISFEQVRFSYPTRLDVEVLKGIDMEIEAGQKVALVGQSGAGKSTIVQLLLRFYQPDSGKLLVNGKPAKTYPLSPYRNHIAIVPQEVILFGGSIRENIAYGKPDASDAEIKHAAAQAHAWEFIQTFPEGMETLVGERGVKLSGGQRQRIAIARAILKDPEILMLDEATSSLDAESEHLVQAALNTLMEGRTTIIIAHRLSTIRQVDQIFVLEDGQIIEQGTHQELVNREGAYNHLLRLQLEAG